MGRKCRILSATEQFNAKAGAGGALWFFFKKIIPKGDDTSLGVHALVNDIDIGVKEYLLKIKTEETFILSR